MKYTVILFQPYLRRFFLNFGKKLKNGTFLNVSKQPKAFFNRNSIQNFEEETKRIKVNIVTKIRRLLGIPNVRIRLDRQGDLYFTYGCLVITRKPYCIYLETGLSLYNYDLSIAKNPVARFIVSILASRKNCKKLVFFSEASMKSFYSTIQYSEKTRKIFEEKSIVIYPPAIEKIDCLPKRFAGNLKLLFPGTFYIKGGKETVAAYQQLRKNYQNVSLTVLTSTHMLRPEDVERMEQIPGLTLLDAKLSEQEMVHVYQSHDILVLPTYREGFGLVLIEGLAYGMPLIITDQYATKETVIEGKNGFIFPDHPLKDYDPQSYRLLGKYYNPSDFYRDLFRFQREGKLKPIERFLAESVEKFLKNPALLEEFSRNSLQLYQSRFDADKVSAQIESVFLESLKK